MDTEVTVAEGDRRFLLVRSGGCTYAIPADQVRHVLRGLACHPVPGSRPHLLGLAQFAGEPLAILDLHALADGVEPQSHHRTTLILGRGVQDAPATVGIAVTEALRVQSLGGRVPIGQADALVAATVDLEGEQVRVVDTSLLVDERGAWGGGGDA